MTTADSDDSVVGSRYMVSTMLIWIVQQDSGKSLSFFLFLRSTCFTADRQPANSAARWRHCRYFYTAWKAAPPLQQLAGGSFSSRLCLYEAVVAMRCRRRRYVAVLGGGRGLELLDYTVAHSLSSSSGIQCTSASVWIRVYKLTAM
jgi:hypothetical protein